MSTGIVQRVEPLRREKTTATLQTNPITWNGTFMDYGSAGLKIDLAKHHLDESVPNKQLERTLEAMRLLEEGTAELRAWFTLNGWTR